MTGGYRLVEVRTRWEREAFLELPWRIYRDDPNWIPHLRQDIEHVFDRRKNGAFRHGDAVRWILLDAGGKVVGRVAAFVDERAADRYPQRSGGMGFFECIHDQEAANLLFGACKQWLEQRGMEAMNGPINFGERTAYWGLLVENFTSPPTYQLNYNPPYYKELFEQYGFRPYYYQYVYRKLLRGKAPEVLDRKSEELRRDPRFAVRSVRGMSNREIAEGFRKVFNAAWAHREGVRPLESRQALAIVKALAPIADPDIAMFAWYDSEPIGFYFNIPEPNQIFKHVHGNLNLIGKAKFLWHKWRRTSRIMYGLVFGVVPAWHGRGVEGALIKFVETDILPLNRYDDLIMLWVGDFNPKMIKICERLEATRYRTLATYRIIFDPSIPFQRSPIED